MTIDECYRIVQLVCNKTQSGNITPTDFNNAAVISQISILSQTLGNPQEYQPGHPVSRYGLGLNQRIMEDIRQILKPSTTLIFTNGIATYPSDCLYMFDMGLTFDDVMIKPVELDEWRILNKSVIKPPSMQQPVYYVVGNNIYVLPITITSTVISYVRTPLPPKWNYTVVNSVPVYSSSGSQDFELGPLLQLRIITRMLGFFGINLNLPEVTKLASALEAQGA